MNKFFLNIYDYLSKHKAFSIALLLVVTALCVFSALRLDYKENIADFLPTDPEKERYTSVYNDLGNQGQMESNRYRTNCQRLAMSCRRQPSV